MQVSAKLTFIRVTPRKARLVADQIRGKAVGRALEFLTFNPKKAARVIKKILESAIANAEHNEGADIDELVVSNILVDDGPTHRRFQARARGRAMKILKRTSHITIEVSDGLAKQ